MTLPGVEPSEEIRQVVIRFVEALRDGDEEALRNRISRQPGFQRFGTDPAERWDDGERTFPLVYRHAPGAPDDGVTVVLDRDSLAALDPTPFDWLVPGMR